MKRSSLAILVLALANLWPCQSWAQRVALLIGNARYDVGPLSNPPKDVAAMASALREVGFRVQTVTDANQAQMKRAVRDFGDMAQGAELAFFYFSGHGTQAMGENYLLPVQAIIRKESDYDVEAVSANSVLRQIVGARPKAAIVVLDACRDNPLAATTRSTSKGLGRMDAPTGSMIAFSTAPNTVASDEGFYARVLAQQIRTRGLELYDVFRNTTAEVRRLSQGRQEPRVSEVSITDRIYLAGVMPALDQALSSIPGSRLPSVAGGVKDCDVCPELVVVPSGDFVMGSPAQELERSIDEGPQMRVTISTFLLGRTEVTQGQWKAVMGGNPSSFNMCGDDCPVESVSWNDAQEYIRRLNARSGQRYRLPSEAEWEYAARGGTDTPFRTGPTITSAQANFDGTFTYNGSTRGERRQRTLPVGSFSANAFGLFDMHGNVWEWVQDAWHGTYNGAPVDGAAWTRGGDEAQRVLRGGAWNDEPRFLRSANRGRGAADFRGNDTGLRIARNP